MRVLILNQTFYPDVAATAQLMWDLARYLEARGHQVTALTSRNLYGTNQQIEKAFERIGNIEIHRAGGTRFGKSSLLGRASDFGSFYVTAGRKLTQLPVPDVILALTSPPMIASLASAYVRWQRSNGRRVAFVHYVMDLYPDAAVASGVIAESSAAHRAMAQLTRRTVRSADAVLVVGRDMKDRLLARYGNDSDAGKVHVIPPWADELGPLPRQDNPLAKSLGVDGTFNVVYSGNLGVAHDVQTLLGAIALTRDDPALRWIFIGGGNRSDALRQEVEQQQYRHVLFLPYQPRERLRESLNLADVHLISQLPAFTGVVVPSKFFGALAVSKPSIMVGPPDAAVSLLIAEHGLGFVAPVGDAQGLVDRLHRLRNDPQLRDQMGSRSLELLRRHYSRQIACEKIELVLEQTRSK